MKFVRVTARNGVHHTVNVAHIVRFHWVEQERCTVIRMGDGHVIEVANGLTPERLLDRIEEAVEI